MSLRSVNPMNGKLIAEYDEMPENKIQSILKLVENEYSLWRETTFEKRKKMMFQAGAQLKEQKNELARLITMEMGKPIKQSLGEIEKCSWVCEYYAENAEQFLENKIIQTNASKSYVTYQPLGIVLAVMPWNFPFWQVFRFAAPALMAGNGGVLKHASNVQGCALAIEKIFRDSGFPENIFRTLVIKSDKVENVINNPRVKAVTLTGSTPAGKAVAAQAGMALKKTVLELGGSDPYIILEDADLDLAVEACVAGRFLNTGQSCIAAKRFIAVEKIHDQFLNKLLKVVKQKRFGNPFDDVDLGPMISEKARNDLNKQVLESVKKGAELLIGGEIPDGEGAFYPATILKNVQPGMPAFDDELFGPVASVIKAKDEEEAIDLANQTHFGLGAAIFTANIIKGERIASTRLEAGCCFVNDFVRSDPRLPFGGIKESGYGRELSANGILEFVNAKTVYIR